MRPGLLVKSVAANLEVIRFPTPSDNTVTNPCPHCSGPLTLHVPDPMLPDRLLGVCERCKHWFLIDLLPDLTDRHFIRLPDHEVIRDLCAIPSDGISPSSQEPGSNPPPSGGRSTSRAEGHDHADATEAG